MTACNVLIHVAKPHPAVKVWCISVQTGLLSDSKMFHDVEDHLKSKQATMTCGDNELGVCVASYPSPVLYVSRHLSSLRVASPRLRPVCPCIVVRNLSDR